MPYGSVEEAEKKNPGLNKYGEKAKRGWLKSFNSCMDGGGSESKCFAVAYSVANKIGKKASGSAMAWGVAKKANTGGVMNRIALELLAVARDVLAIEFPTQDAMDAYLKEHPDADRSMHKVVEKKEEGPAKTEAPAAKPFVSKPHRKAKPSARAIEKVRDILKSGGVDEDSDELSEMAGFKKTLGQRIPEAKKGQFYVRNEAKLKKDFLANMSPENYESRDAFDAAKKRIKEMPVSDFGKILAALTDEDEE